MTTPSKFYCSIFHPITKDLSMHTKLIASQYENACTYVMAPK